MWTEPIEQIIEWNELNLFSKQVDESELDLPTAPVLEDDIVQLFEHAVKLVGTIKPNLLILMKNFHYMVLINRRYVAIVKKLNLMIFFQRKNEYGINVVS